jgi:hypothetical protein
VTFSKHKFYVALGGMFAAAGAAFADGSLTSTEVAGLLVAAATAAGVFFVPNKPTA